MFRVHLKRVLIGGLAGLVIALALALFILPKVYEGDIELQVGVNMELQQVARYSSSLSEDLERIISEGEGGDSVSETQVLSSEALFAQALQSIAQKSSKPGLLNDEESLFNMYDVTNPKDSQLAVIRVRAYDPQTAADLANEIGAAYGDLRTQRAQEAVGKALTYMESAADRSTQQLAAIDQKVTAYRKKAGISDVQVASQTSAQYLTLTRQSLDLAKSQLVDAQGQLAVLETELPKTPKEIVAQNGTQKRNTVQFLETSEATLLQQRADNAVNFTDQNPVIISLDRQINSVRARLAAARKQGLETGQKITSPNPVYQSLVQQMTTARATRDGLIKRVASLESTLASASTLSDTSGASQAGLEALLRERLVAETQYAANEAQLRDLQTRAKQIRSPGVLYAAVPKNLVVAPNPVRYSLVGIIGGVALALVFSLSLESMRLRVYTSAQLTELTGLPVFATIPALGLAERRRTVESLIKGKPKVLEPFRYMALSGIVEGRTVRSVLFTGVGTNTGATTAALQYAVAASEAGQRVVLVDFNAKNPTITRMMGLTSATGVVNLLNRSLLPGSGESLTLPTAHDRLQVFPVGSSSVANDWEINSASIQGMLEMLYVDSDLVVIDCAPSDVVSDAAALCSHVDRVALVVSASETAFKYVPAAYEILNRAGAKEVGLVLSGANPLEEPFLLRGRYAA